MSLTKIGGADLYAITSVTSNTVSVGAGVSVATYYAVDVRVRMGRGTGSAFTTAPIIRIEKSVYASPALDQWTPVCQFQPALGATIGSQAVSGTSNAGDGTLVLAAGTNFAAGDYVFIQNTTIGNSEWVHVTSISSATLTLWSNLVRAQTSATARNQAEEYQALIDCVGVQQLRVVVDAHGSGQAAIVHVDFGAVSGL